MFSKRLYQNFVLLTTLAVSLLLVSSAYALKGGPDKYGYHYIDSMDRGGPKYSWYEFSKDKIKLEGKTSIGNGLTTAYPIGFNFEFYGKNYNRFQISDNGYIIFYVSRPNAASKGFTYNGENVPSAAYPNGMLAPLWGDNDGTA